MRLGIDFDNTIARYDALFVEEARSANLVPNQWKGSKKKIRDFLLDQKDGEKSWQILQGKVYGKAMHRATLMPGIAWFLYRCSRRGIPIVIVSHKTEFGHYDADQIPLRKVAMEWMEKQGFFDQEVFGLRTENVHFEGTRKEKVRRIGQLGITHFVDDLVEIFSEPEFPNSTIKILHMSTKSLRPRDSTEDIKRCEGWLEIGQELLGLETEEDRLYVARKLLNDSTITECKLAGIGRNSRVYRALSKDKGFFAIKRYPISLSDERDRLGVEYQGCQFLRSHGIDAVPQAKVIDRKTEIGVFEWICGEEVVGPSKADLVQAVSFINRLHQARELKGAKDLPLAAEACLSGEELFRQIHFRREALNDVLDNYPELSDYLIRKFDPLYEKILGWSRVQWPLEQNFNENLISEFQTLSPSDFGFHNALQEKSGTIRFLDLEYFGWDDPVKLVSDFWWHPGMELEENLKISWLRHMIEIFSEDKAFVRRLNAAHPVYGLRWALIVLKCFLNTSDYFIGYTESQLSRYLRESARLCEMVYDWNRYERSIN